MLATNSNTFSKSQIGAFYSFVLLLLLFTGISLIKELYALAAVPVVLLGALVIIRDYRVLYYGFWALLPFSVEFYFGSLGMDLPTEPIMILLTGIGVLLLITNVGNISLKYVRHPISIVLLVHVFWILFTSIYSQSQVVSFKFFLAKIWYVVPFFFLTFHFLKDEYDVAKILKILIACLSVAVCIVLLRHAALGFTFQSSHEVVRPIFRNHVNYAAIQVIVLPFIWALRRHSTKHNKIWTVILLIFIVGTYFSYTRAAQGCIVIAIGAYFIIKYKLTRLAITAACILAILFSSFMISNSRYLDFAPDYENTVAHTNFDNLLEATYKMEDISTMERVYRWVAGGIMIGEKPIIGFGPGSFYFHYTKYTVRSFETYVSDNPEKSGIHSYYLMTWVEQGTIGLILFLGFCFLVLILGERSYHRTTSKLRKDIIMAAILSMIVICTLNVINDLVEVDKVGPLFFLSASIIVLFDRDKK